MVTCTLGPGPGGQSQFLNLGLPGCGSRDGAAGTELIPSTVCSVERPRTQSHTHTHLTRLILNPQHGFRIVLYILFSLFYKRIGARTC